MTEFACFFAGRDGAGPCEGSLIRAHLVDKQKIRQTFRKGAWKDGDSWVNRLPFEALTDPETAAGWTHLSLDEILDDRRCWTPMCGGLTGLTGHHGRFDNPNDELHIPRLLLPARVEEFAVEFSFDAFLDRKYGLKQVAA
ncbi:MAG TPA: hypothetical protein VNR42_01035 [Solirubrobacteraceae bacterium]|nr:hypothetical protein [Solirubrobacteraceae bacterium]